VVLIEIKMEQYNKEGKLLINHNLILIKTKKIKEVVVEAKGINLFQCFIKFCYRKIVGQKRTYG